MNVKASGMNGNYKPYTAAQHKMADWTKLVGKDVGMQSNNNRCHTAQPNKTKMVCHHRRR